MSKTIDVMGVEAEAKKDWEMSADLRMEFENDFETFLALRLAEARGQIRIL